MGRARQRDRSRGTWPLLNSSVGEAEDCRARVVLEFGHGDLAGDDRLPRVLHDYFAWATTTTMSRYHRSADDVPDGLQIPHWSWDGLVSETGPGAIS